jgi:tyrosinase
MRVRKNVSNLTTAEKTAFVNAVLALKNQPSVLNPGQQGRYDDYVQLHMSAMMAGTPAINPSQPTFMPGWAHDGPAFFSWHRVLLLQFENDLQAASQDSSVTIPYWDWTDPASWPFTNDFLGGDGTGRHKRVQTGPFAFQAPARWTLIVKDQTRDPNYLQRQFGVDSTAQNLPTSTDVSNAIGITPYSSPPWKGTSAGPGSSLRFQAQYGVHNLVHRYVGGTMGYMTSPNDPVFWLHHCNIDRLWAQWQPQHPTEAAYLPTAGGPTGHNLNDNMIFSTAPPAPWAGSTTSQSVIDHHALGYQYDSEPTAQIAAPRVRVAASSPVVNTARSAPNKQMANRARANFPLLQELTVRR